MKKMTDEKRDRRSWYQLKFLEELSDVFTFNMLHVPRFWTSSFLNTDYNVERDCAVIYMLVKGEFNILQMLPSSWMRYCIYQFLPISHVPSYLSLLLLTIIPDFSQIFTCNYLHSTLYPSNGGLKIYIHISKILGKYDPSLFIFKTWVANGFCLPFTFNHIVTECCIHLLWCTAINIH